MNTHSTKLGGLHGASRFYQSLLFRDCGFSGLLRLLRLLSRSVAIFRRRVQLPLAISFAANLRVPGLARQVVRKDLG